ncbi:H-ATPase-like protein [Treponema primitia ZAS-2]|uniref:H-ATPase-like protein n=1 Tax=Treponema primitia (strain ATCC BAA-887 / DSM 12427 / ZAS-2) TaxID=545694 RepID=F5YGX8_TREPZ|nr:ATP synthase subunit C [Treponema primitia]AEF84670.1 H-ATPase-like protein [Treponema primitia ZAS-2]
MKRRIVLFTLVLFALAVPVFAQEAAEAAQEGAGNTSVWKYFAAALAVGVSCIAGGIAVGQIGAAAMGAMSENPELSGKALPYAGLAEGICLWGFLVALLIMIL